MPIRLATARCPAVLPCDRSSHASQPCLPSPQVHSHGKMLCAVSCKKRTDAHTLVHGGAWQVSLCNATLPCSPNPTRPD